MDRKIGTMMIGLVATLTVVLLSSILVTPVLAQLDTWEPDFVKLVGGGLIDTEGFEVDSSIYGHRCYILVSGGKTGGSWRGHVRWIDLDWKGGVLVALFTVEGGFFMHDPNPGHITEMIHLYGQAEVFVDGESKGTYGTVVVLADSAYVTDGEPGAQPDWVAFHIGWDPKEGRGTYYETWHPRLARGDIRTWWYPEYTG